MKMPDFLDLVNRRTKVYGSEITATPEMYGVRIRMKFIVPDSNTHHPIRTEFAKMFPNHEIEYMDEKMAIQRLWFMVRERFIHEADEHFRVDGSAPYYPHPEVRDTTASRVQDPREIQKERINPCRGCDGYGTTRAIGSRGVTYDECTDCFGTGR